MSELVRAERYEDLKKTLDAFSPVNFQPECYVSCGNHDVSAILTMESRKAYEKGFCLKTMLVVPPTLPLEGGELCSLLTNLIDNAIEANIRFGLKDDIIVRISLKEQYLYIAVTNSLPPDADSRQLLQFRTSKAEPDEHGLGLQIVKRIAEKYNGHFLADVENSRFIA